MVCVSPVYGSLLAIVASEYLLQPVFPECDTPIIAVRLCAIVLYGK